MSLMDGSQMRNGMIKDSDGDRVWYRNGQLHRDNGPAIEREDGTREWYQNDLLHREGGPAYEREDGTRAWYLNGKLHRGDGPAIEYADGDRSWWLNDIKYTEEEYKQELLVRKWGLSVDNRA